MKYQRGNVQKESIQTLTTFQDKGVSQILYNEILAIDGKWYGKVLLFISFYLSLKTML